VELPPLSAYVHLPWCERKCPYCDFNSHEAAAPPEEQYIDALLDDLRAEYAGETRPLQTVFIGGGTPSLFSVAAVARLLEGMRTICAIAPDAEITLEANPGSSDSAKLAGYASAGATRFSIGAQSFDDDALQRLGRIHDARDAHRAIDAVRTSGAQSFNLDLMHGLPGQSPAQGLRDLQLAIAADAPHLSWYQLTIEPNTRFYSAPPLLPVEDELAELEESGIALLESAGYRRYEVSAWARPGQECRHNLNYWRFGDYLAIGAGAHGKRTDSTGVVRRYAKTRRPADYMASGGTRRVAQRVLDADDLRGEFMLNALRLSDGFTLGLFEQRTGLNARVLEESLGRLEQEGFLSVSSEQVRTTALGRRFLDDVVAHFLSSGPNMAGDI
jgi:oxygen-independent coproporphyrinogen-3 oxidase